MASINTELHSGAAATDRLRRLLDALAGEEAEGQTIGMVRQGSGLEPSTLDFVGMDIKDVLRILRQCRCELLILDGRNRPGEPPWKAVYHPQSTLLVIIPEGRR